MNQFKHFLREFMLTLLGFVGIVNSTSLFGQVYSTSSKWHLKMDLPNKEHISQVQGMGKHFNCSNTRSSVSQPRSFTKEVKTNFEKMQEQMTALQRYCKSLQEQMLWKGMGASTKRSCEGHPQTLCGVEEHVESIVTPPIGTQVNV